MSTSLAQQLKRLALPQTSLLVQGKTRPSLLFDPREAAKFDRETFYDIGVSGLEELIKLNPRFEEFQRNLFDLASQSFERSVEDKKANKVLNKLIRRFLLLLSPYFLLKASHKALEWLVNRYHIESFNVDDVMGLILPYHDTRMFVRVVQMIELSDTSGRWHWLHPIQGPGVPLSKTALLNRCASDQAFLHFICKLAADAVKEYGDKAGVLSTLLAFHCTTVVGALQHVKRVGELQVTYILKSLLGGVTSPVLDYTAGCYMIVAQLSGRTQMSSNILHGLVRKIAKCKHPSLSSQCALLLVLLYQTQNSVRDESVPAKTVNLLMRQIWFVPALGQLQRAGVHISPFFIPLVESTLAMIQSSIDDRGELCEFLERLVETAADESTAQVLIQTAIKSFDADGLTASNIKSSVDEEHTVNRIEDSEEVISWYSNFLKSLERRYAEAYDRVIHSSLYGSPREAEAVRILLGVKNEGSMPVSSTDLLVKVFHPSASVRAEAVSHLMRIFSSLQERDKEMVRSAVIARLADDSSKVVRTTLEVSTEVLVEIVGVERLVEELLLLAMESLDRKKVACLVVTHLCSDLLRTNSAVTETRVLLALLPYLMPVCDEDVDVMGVLLKQHSFFKQCEFMSAFMQELRAADPEDVVAGICSAFIRCLEDSKEHIPDVQLLLGAAEKVPQEKRKPIDVVMLILMLAAAAVKEPDQACSQRVLNVAVSYVECYQMASQQDGAEELDGRLLSTCMTTARKGVFPLAIFLHCILQLLESTPFPSEDRKWWNLDHHKDSGQTLTFIVRALEILITGCGATDRVTRTQCALALRKFFQMNSLAVSAQVRLLCNILACPTSRAELRLRCVRLVAALLRQSSNSVSWTLSLQEPVVPALLTAVSSPLSAIRAAALDCIQVLTTFIGAGLDRNTFIQLLESLQDRREEIMLDAEQLPLVLYTLLSPDPVVQSLLKQSQRPQLSAALNALLDCILSTETPPYVVVALLNMLTSVNSKDIFNKLFPLGKNCFSKSKESGGCLDCNSTAILSNIVQRVTSDTAECLKNPECWSFFEAAIKDWETELQGAEGKTCPSVLMMQQVSRELYEALDEPLQQQLLKLLVIAASDSELPEVASATGRAVKKINLNSKLVAVLLEDMKKANIPKVSTGRTRRSRKTLKESPSPELLTTDAWRYGITLLEWVQSKKKLQSAELLLSPLFAILEICLELEEQPPVEYSKQLLLSCLLHCCQKLSPDGVPVDAVMHQTFNMEAIVQCIRASQNPHTHHHALLLLSHVAGMMPDQVLHNIMAIFTFMGSSILRQDDAYSLQVISKIVDTIIPILVKAGGSATERDSAVCSVLRVFADSALHVPEHRRLPLFQKVVATLGTENSLWLLLCLVVEAHVAHSREDRAPHRQEFALNLTLCFPPRTVIATCINMMKYVQTLPMQKEETAKQRRASKPSPDLLPGLFDVSLHTPKQLRHYKFSICTFLSSLLSSTFVNRVAALNDQDTLELEPLYRQLIEHTLTYIQAISRKQDTSEQNAAKYWNAMLSLNYDILDKVNALLPADMFIAVMRNLLKHKLITLRRKALELLNTRLQLQTSWNHEALTSLLPLFVEVMDDIGDTPARPEVETIQQAAMLTLKLLARQLAAEDPVRFKQILERVTQLAQSPAVQGNLLASVVLCLAELVSTLRAHAIANLNQFVPTVIKILRTQRDIDSPNLLSLSAVTAVLKIVESLPHFLSPYLHKLLLEVCYLSTRWQHRAEDSKVSPVLHKLKTIRQKLSSALPVRVLLPAVSQCYTQLLKVEQYSPLGPLFSVLSESFSTLTSSEFTHLMPQLTPFFLSALQFRADCCDGSVSQDDITEVEEHVVQALVTLVMKLSEATFRPLYYTLFHWATSSDAHKDRVVTFYRLSSSIAENLKGLFLLFAGRLVPNAATLLEQTNVLKSSDGEIDNEEGAQLLLKHVLQTLLNVFQHDCGQKFITKERFDVLMQPLVDQLENTLGGVEALEVRSSSLLTPCIVQFAVAVADDALWKQLNYQILLKTRHNLPKVRLAALNVLCTLATTLGEDFLPLLPETVPFLAELLEDEEEAVEMACQKAVRELEEVLGEPLKKYF
ncbi:HEAT repeat-containing protein 1 [Periplaneta americana]|uniref:HEAT repeat-containing protein 1 n=1 Tax=Periplaneta americana TaxID=6978 RepID=UPI0037E8311F